MAEEVGKAIPTVPVGALKAVDFSGIAEFIEHRDYVNEVVPEELNRIASTFKNKVVFYDVNGNVGAYDYTTFDQRI